MKRVVILAAIGCALASPLGAQPAALPNPSLDCPLEGSAMEQRVLAMAAASQQLTDAPAELPQGAPAALEAVLANVARCAATHRWTGNQRELARGYVLIRLTRDEMVRRYAAQNVDLSFIDQMATAGRPGEPPPFETMVARVRAQGVGDDRPDSAGDIVHIYMTLVYRMGEIRARFADPDFIMR